MSLISTQSVQAAVERAKNKVLYSEVGTTFIMDYPQINWLLLVAVVSMYIFYCRNVLLVISELLKSYCVSNLC